MSDDFRERIRELAERAEQPYRERDAHAERSLATAQNRSWQRTPRGADWPFPLQVGKPERAVSHEVGASSALRVTALAVGLNHALALRTDGSVVAWGENASLPEGLSGVVAIAAGRAHSMALRRNGTVAAWGNNGQGQTDVPAGLTGVVAIAAGHGHNLALRGDGTVVAWGFNDAGQTRVPEGLRDVVAVAAGWWHSVALRSDGSVVAWGHPDSDQRHVPYGLVGAVAIAAGYENSSAVLYDGSVFDWGGDSHFLRTPPAFTDVVEIVYGKDHRLALRADGTLVADGANNGGIHVPSDLPAVIAIAGAASHFLALTADGQVRGLGVQGADDAVLPVPSGVSEPAPIAVARVNAPPSATKTDLMHYAALGDLAGVRAAIESGADARAVDGDGDSALRYALGTGNTLVLDELLAAGSDPNGVSTLANGTPGFRILHAFAEIGWTEGVRALVRHGAAVDAKGPGGITPMMLAAGGGRDATVVELGVAGADVNARDDDGDPVMFYAASRGRPDTVARLLALGAAPNVSGGVSGSPLLVAASCASPVGRRPSGVPSSDYAEVVVKMLRAGADPSEMYASGLVLQRSDGGFDHVPGVDAVLAAVREHEYWSVIYLTPSGRAGLL